MPKNDESPSEREIYAMRRANGDWFALEDRGRLRVPLFHSTHDAMMARLRNFGMLLFKPVPLDARLLKEIVPLGGESDVDLCMVNDPFASLSRGSPVERAQLALLIGSPHERQTVPHNGNGSSAPGLNTLPQRDSEATETWDDEEASTQSVREVAHWRVGALMMKKASSTSDRLLKEIPGVNA
jgi:hypothetical protein